MKPIYKPKGRALEYCGLAINIYTGCPHGCTYCYAARNAKRWGRDFTDVRPKAGIVEAVEAQLAKGTIKGETIQLCFTCDPYPMGIDTTVTREVIRAIKASGNHVQILTKGCETRDFDLLDENDWFGVTISGSYQQMEKYEANAAHGRQRLDALLKAHYQHGIKTWVSLEPVFNTQVVYDFIKAAHYVDEFKIGKLNYYASDIDLAEFGRECERLCIKYGRNYTIKDDLRALMRGESNENT